MFRSEDILWWYIGLQDILMWSIRTFAKKRPLILDAGCGTGKNIQILSHEGYNVVGFDASEEAIRYSKKRGLNVKRGTITKIPFRNNAFDCIICTDVFGILKTQKERHKAVSEFNRVLKTSGILILHCAALEELRSQHDTVTHINRRFTKSALASYFSRRDWQVMKLSYRIFFLFIPLFAIKLIKRILRRGSSATSDQIILPNFLNNLLIIIQLFENKILKWADLPIGTSLLFVVKKRPPDEVSG